MVTRRYPRGMRFFVQPDSELEGGGSVDDGDLGTRINEFVFRAPGAYEDRWCMLCFLIGHNSSVVVRDQVAPRLSYWNSRTASVMHVICIGIGSDNSQAAAARAAKSIGWLESKSVWRYSGDTDLVLMNARVVEREVQLQGNRVVALTVERALEDGAIKSLPNFVERMVKFTETSVRPDPVGTFSDRMAMDLAGSGLKSVLLAGLPKSLRKPARSAFHFYVRELPVGG